MKEAVLYLDPYYGWKHFIESLNKMSMFAISFELITIAFFLFFSYAHPKSHILFQDSNPISHSLFKYKKISDIKSKILADIINTKAGIPQGIKLDYIKAFMFDVTTNSDNISLELANFYYKTIQSVILDIEPPEHPKYITEIHQEFRENLNNYKAKHYNITDDFFAPEVQTEHHGLHSLNSKIIKYIRLKDILDGGSSIGDSAYALEDYSPNRIACCEIDEYRRNYFNKLYRKPWKWTNIGSGVGNITKKITYRPCGLSKEPENEEKESWVTTIDQIRSDQRMYFGLVKLSVPNAYSILNNALKTINASRPVFSVRILSHDDFFLIPQFFRRHNYFIEYRGAGFDRDSLCAATIIGVPQEVLYEEYRPRPVLPAEEN